MSYKNPRDDDNKEYITNSRLSVSLLLYLWYTDGGLYQ